MGGRTIQVSGFALTDSAEYAKDFLERISGPGTIYVLKLRRPKNISATSTAFAIVQFDTQESASLVENAVQRNGLRMGRFHLKIRPADHDIVPRPRIPMFCLEDADLHFGCLVKPNVLSVLWKAKEVSVKFGFDMKTIHFYLSYNFKKYKLEISYKSIWEMQLHSPPACSSRTKFLLIQLQAVPKIYIWNYSGLMPEDHILNYFRDGTDDQWTRTTDFTPSASIGQSSILCLELPQLCDLPNIGDYFFHYKEFNLDFECHDGYPYSCGTGIVPIVKSPNQIDVPFEILYKINNLVHFGILSGPTLDDNFFCHVSPKFVPIHHIKRALFKMSDLKSTCLNPTDWLSAEYSNICKLRYTLQRSPQITPDNGLVYVHRMQVTPAKVYFYDPEINVSNRVVRHFSADIDNFLRISFVDEDCEKLRSADLSPRSAPGNYARRTALYDRVLSVLSNGISIGDKRFEFLAFSSSQLRDNSAWMFASRPGLTANDIRKWMGDFRNIRNVAKYAARLGQSFSSSTETLKVRKSEVEEIPDITNGTKYIFSDGVGKISADFAMEVAMKCKLKNSAPSVFQIRYGGYKGVVTVDPRSSRKLSLRKSMLKFQSENITLDVLAYSKYQPCFLNRQLITLLSTLGVGDSVFELKQEEAVRRLNRMVNDPQAAIAEIELMPMGEVTNVVKELLLCGYHPDHEPYLSMLLQTFRASKLLELKTKSRILIPKGRAMMGCLDETRTLKYGQVFIQASSTADAHGKFIVTGKVVVAKNPCLHPGDIRVLQAVNVPVLHHMFDCVVFQAKSSFIDITAIILFVLCTEVQEYFTNYIVNESLGIIANAHVVFADKEYLKAESAPCLQLAKLFSVAVDFPKTGVPAQIPYELHVREYPDFMEKLDKATYVSKGVIGKLYREIKKHTPHINYFTKDVARRSYDSDLIVDGYEDYIAEAIEFKQEYDLKLGNLVDHYGIKSEAEIISGCILQMARHFTKRSDADAIRMAVRSWRKEAMSWFTEMGMDENGIGQDDLDAKASAWYHVTYHPEYWGCYNGGYDRPHFISFPWCVYDRLIRIKQMRNLKRKMVLK